MKPTLGPKALADRIDAVLPQTQCRRCGFDGCRPYAEAIAGGEAIDRCPPGGDAVIAALAALTARPAVPLDASRGAHGLLAVARIDEALCIGCTLCIDACPMDAIAGAAKRMHTVLPALCSGCELCIAPCPVDCIAMIAAGRAWSPADALAAKERFEAHTRRLRSRHHEKRPAGGSAVAAPPSLASSDGDAQKRRADVAAARARAEARRRQAAKTTT